MVRSNFMDVATASAEELPSDIAAVSGRNLRDLLEDRDPRLRASIAKLVESLHDSPTVVLGWSSRI
jgi:hypothetical protein